MSAPRCTPGATQPEGWPEGEHVSRPRRFFTSDLHIGHVNIIGYCDRPYFSAQQMDRDLVVRWNNVVGPGDEVIVVGDLALGKLDLSLERARDLNGCKRLIPGNHDACWAGRKGRAARSRYEDAGFEVLDEWVRMELPGPRGPRSNHAVEVCHFPWAGDSYDGDRFDTWRPTDHGQWLIHGHVHDRWRQRGRLINVGVDAWGGLPVSEARLVELIVAGPQDLPPLAWNVDGAGRSLSECP